MEDTLLIKVTNQKVMQLLRELEVLQLIKVIPQETPPPKAKLSTKYKGMLSKAQGANLQQHIEKMRAEWDNI
jgi:hypothetical protein